ncbi:hypothetical protein JGS39_03960 [Streptomyces sp. P01-B04]|uniref:hypothetical protein n=1 Tax=Streptomyces poriferorum TaxID=2798799 RepID=UPI001C5DDB50|nr:hypothetical protein [Streptomyces poriferorum]MBW5248188.1 hypothetical protein [Streptomyces poriferorum]MBW5255808.1 hypothetical protein [Streptomyces poriferorum]
MVVTRKALLGVAAAAAMASTVALGVGGTAAAVGAPFGTPAGRNIAPEADVSLHGHVSLWGTGLGIWLRSENRGPADLDGATVRLRVSVPLAGRQQLPQECLRADLTTVLCRTGALHADGSEQRQLALELQLAGRPAEVIVRIDTVWNGGATDRNAKNSEHEVLAPATGDEYVF